MKKNVRNVMTLIVPIILVVIFVFVLLVYILGRSAQEEDLRKDALLSAVAEQKMRSASHAECQTLNVGSRLHKRAHASPASRPAVLRLAWPRDA